MVRETGVQSLVESYQRFTKWYLMPPCRQYCKIQIESKWSNREKGIALSPTPLLKRGPRVALDNSWLTYLYPTVTLLYDRHFTGGEGNTFVTICRINKYDSLNDSSPLVRTPYSSGRCKWSVDWGLEKTICLSPFPNRNTSLTKHTHTNDSISVQYWNSRKLVSHKLITRE